MSETADPFDNAEIEAATFVTKVSIATFVVWVVSVIVSETVSTLKGNKKIPPKVPSEKIRRCRCLVVALLPVIAAAVVFGYGLVFIYACYNQSPYLYTVGQVNETCYFPVAKIVLARETPIGDFNLNRTVYNPAISAKDRPIIPLLGINGTYGYDRNFLEKSVSNDHYLDNILEHKNVSSALKFKLSVNTNKETLFVYLYLSHPEDVKNYTTQNDPVRIDILEEEDRDNEFERAVELQATVKKVNGHYKYDVIPYLALKLPTDPTTFDKFKISYYIRMFNSGPEVDKCFIDTYTRKKIYDEYIQKDPAIAALVLLIVNALDFAFKIIPGLPSFLPFLAGLLDRILDRLLAPLAPLAPPLTRLLECLLAPLARLLAPLARPLARILARPLVRPLVRLLALMVCLLALPILALLLRRFL